MKKSDIELTPKKVSDKICEVFSKLPEDSKKRIFFSRQIF